MRGRTTWIAGASLAALALVLTSGFAAAAVHPAATTYTVVFTEVGLAKGTSWSVTFNGVTYSSTKATLVIKSVAAATSIYWYTASTIAGGTGVQFTTPNTYGYMTVPNQQAQVIVYQEQFEVDVVASSYSYGSTSPGGWNWYLAGYHYPITALAYGGCAFTGWSALKSVATLGNKSAPSTYMIVQGTGVVTANVKPTSTKVTFYEEGLPTGTSWTVTVGGVSYASTTSTLSVGKLSAGYWYYSVPSFSKSAGVEYYAEYGASSSLYVPFTTSVSVSFAKAYYVTMSAGTGGYVGAGYSGWYPAGSTTAINAAASTGYDFSTWTSTTANLSFAHATTGGTALTINGPGNISATFAAGKQCTSCNATFTEAGLPKGTSWTLALYQTTGWVYYTSNKASMTFGGLTTGIAWAAYQVLTTSNPYVGYETAQTGGSLSVPAETNQTLVYEKVYQVSTGSNTGGTVGYAPGLSSTAWVTPGSVIPLVSERNDYNGFHGWTSSNKSISISKKSQAATFATINGPGTITADFRAFDIAISFTENGLPAGSSWAIVFNGQGYTSSGSTLNITGLVAGNYNWYVQGPVGTATSGVVFFSVNPNYQSIETPYQQSQVVSFYKAYQVAFATTGKTGGSVLPTTTGYYAAGSELAITAVNGSAANFSAWSGSASGLVFSSSSSPATFVTINGPGTISAKFV